MRLIIAEKPSVAKEIALIVNANTKNNGFIEGNEWIVSWCLGHLVGLCLPEDYDKKYSERKIEDLPIFPSEWKTKVLKDTEKQYNTLKKLMNRKDVSEIVCATDAGREGEHIFRMVYRQVGCSKPVKRLWISSLEKSAIEEGLGNLKDDKDFDNLADGAMARDKADWLVGMNVSRLFYSSVGRVQTPTLALIVNREKEIEKFISQPFYFLEFTFKDGEITAKTSRYEDEEKCLSLKEKYAKAEVFVKHIEKEDKKSNPPQLYDLTTLQREANRFFGLTASQTLEVAQSLYEKKILTYPRTDSSYLTEEMEESTKALLSKFMEQKSFSFIPSKVSFENVKCLIRPEKVSDHHALLPTNKLSADLYEKLSDSEKQVISMVLARVFQAVSSPKIIATTKVDFACQEIEFSVVGKTVLDDGYTEIVELFLQMWGKNKNQNEEKTLPNFSEGDSFILENIEVGKGKTSPPTHYTEDTLLSAMEHAGNQLYEDEDVEKKGIGTPATRASVIDGLINKGKYLYRDKKFLLPTERGKNLIEILPERLTSLKMTAEWEEKIQKIEKGNGSSLEFIKDIEAFICTLIAEYDNLTEQQRNSLTLQQPKKVLGKCPRCGKNVVEGKNSFYCEDFLVRSNETPKCGFLIKKDNLFFTNKGKKLTPKMVSDLLKDGEILVKGLQPKDTTKATYDATIQLNDIGTYVNFKLIFDN